MRLRMCFLPYLTCLFLFVNSQGFYKPKTYKTISTYTPKTLEQLKDLLCTKKTILFMEGGCDSDPKEIMLNKIFDFTDYQESEEKEACQSCPGGQWSLKSAGGCGDKNSEKVKYKIAGLSGLEVGSNKIIVGINGGGLKGKGLKLVKSTDVQIRSLVITDINPHVRQGGSAIELVGAKNVLVDGNYFMDVGGAMVVSEGGGSTDVTVSSNLFDGKASTANSPNCDGARGVVWRLAGEAERVRFEYNTVHHAAGALEVSAQKGSKTVVHLYRNVIHDVKHSGVVSVEDKASSVLAEGNVLADANVLVYAAGEGYVYVPQTEADEIACQTYIKRQCELNTVVRSKSAAHANSMEVLRDIKVIYDADARYWGNWLFWPSRK